MKKSKKIILSLFIVGFLFIVSSIIITMLTTQARKYKDVVYCSDHGMCYIYDGLYLKYYEDEDESEDNYLDYEVNSCIYTSIINTCDEKIISWDQNKMYIKTEYKGNEYITGYYNVDKELGKLKDIDLSTKIYKNKELELFFVDNSYVIVSGPNKTQEKCSYHINAYDFDKYASMYYECPNKSYKEENSRNSYTYDIEKELIIGFQKTTKDKLKYINFSYFDRFYNYVISTTLYKNGHYVIKPDNNTNVEEIWINNNKITTKTKLLGSSDYLVEENDLDIKEYNDKYILYDYKGNSYSLFYDLEKDTLCIYGACYEKVS